MADPLRKAILTEYAAPLATKWQDSKPSKTLDTHLSNSDFVTTVALQLGVDVAEEVGDCPFCGEVMDTRGIHAMSCTCGGDAVAQHNSVRDEVFEWCKRARLHPDLEKAGLLHRLGTPEQRRRPADVLVCARASFLANLPGERSLVEGHKVALDFTVINALGQGHRTETLEGQLVAATRYSKKKCDYLDTQRKCAEEGIAFEPMVFTCQGGVERRAAAILHRIAECVAAAEEKEIETVKGEMRQRLSILVARGNARAVRRRGPVTSSIVYKVGRWRATAELLDEAA